MSTILRSSKFVRYFSGLARGILISNRQDIDRSLLQNSQYLAGVFNSASNSITSLQSNTSFDRTLRQLDETARRTGRISLKEVQKALNELKTAQTVSAAQSLMVIRCCGNLVPEESPEHRTKLVEEIWTTFEKHGVLLDISHYNALLKVYLENEHKFLPTEFLAKLEKHGIEPNRVTYQRLIAGYCQLGDIAGATKILEFMKEKQLPVSEGVFNALVVGHSRANDMESAEGILAVMKQASLEPSNETYCNLICGYAERGDKAAIDRLITDCKVKDVLLSDKEFLEIAHAAAVNGHNELVDEILKNVRFLVGYNQDAANVMIRLITAGKDEAAYKVFQTMTPVVKPEGMPNMSGHLIIKQMVKSNRSDKEILSICEKLQKDGHTSYGLNIALETSFYHGNVDLTLNLLRQLKDKQEPIRNHYFWPSMVTLGTSGQPKRIVEILQIMTSEFMLSPNFETITDYYLPYTKEKSHQAILQTLLEAGLTRRQVVLALFYKLLSDKKLQEARKLAVQYIGTNLRTSFLNRALLEVLQQTNNVKDVVSVVHAISCTQPNQQVEGEEDVESTGEVLDVPDRFLVGVASLAQTRQILPQVLEEMLGYGLSINPHTAEIVESRLQGDQFTPEVSEMLATLSSGNHKIVVPDRTSEYSSPIQSTAYLERARERLKTSGQNQDGLIPTLRSLFHAYCNQGDLENALRIKQEWVEDLKQELTIGWYASLLDLYATKGSFDEAKQCFEKIKELSNDSVIELDSDKVLKFAKLFVLNNKVDEAIEVISEVQPRKELNFATRTCSWQVLSAVAETTKDPEVVRKVLNNLVVSRYCGITNATLGPIIKAHLLKEDLAGALKEFEVCVQKYRATPWKNELANRFIEKEDATNLQTLVDLSTQVHGEINSLYDLVLNFVECGRIKQARKILETPGLNARTNRLHFACERYVKDGSSAHLEGLVQVTKDLPHIDRAEIYSSLLDTYCQSDNVDKAYGLWTKMQEEDVPVTDEFLFKLGNFLKSKDLQVPFAIPENVKVSTTQKQTGSDTLLSAIKAMDVNEALKIRESLKNNGTQLTKNEMIRLCELLIEKNRLKDAVNLISSQQNGEVPPVRILNFLIAKLCENGSISLMNDLGSLLNEEVRKRTSFINKYMNCAVAAGKAKDELNKIERSIDAATTAEEIDTLTATFPRGGIHGVLESSPSYHDQVVSIVEKYAKKGSLVPANCLCMFYLANGQTEAAKELYQRYNLDKASKIMFKPVLQKARQTSNENLIQDLLSLLENSASTTTEVYGIIYSNLINIYVSKENYEGGLSKLEECLSKSVSIENIYPNTLSMLKEGLASRNIPFKYTIPERRQKEESSSSSSSDAESKKSMRAKQ